MGLLGKAGRALRRALLVRFMRGLVRDVERGDYGEDAMKVLSWLRANKTKVGVAVTFLAGGCQAIGLTEVAGLLFTVAAALVGAGALPSDREERARPRR